MKRRNFIKDLAVIYSAGSIAPAMSWSTLSHSGKDDMKSKDSRLPAPRAITMWDFSWLERRWPGAGYEDWDLALDELKDRGYDAVRIDAYPHLIAEDSQKTWTLNEVWNTQEWGSPDMVSVQVQPALNQFIAKCRERDIKVGLSSWFRQDSDMTLMKIDSPAKMAEIWIKTLDSIAEDHLLDALLYVDLCNEWPGDLWAPFFKNDPPEHTWTYWHTEKSMAYMKESVERVRTAYPGLPLCYSFTGGQPALYAEKDLSFFDLLEHHTWIAQLNDGEFYEVVGYHYERFSPKGYKNLVKNCERVYRERRDYWHQELIREIQTVSTAARKAGLPLITTECWGIVDYKDWPGLNWEMVREMCETGVKTAAETGQWIAIATSNFCGPQFVGMWRDVKWHQKMTTIIKSAPIRDELLTEQIKNALG